jgi:hypothetical protein
VTLASLTNYVLVAFCIASCYRDNQSLYFTDEVGQRIHNLQSDAMKIPIKQAKIQHEAGRKLAAVSLSPASVFGALELISSAIEFFTQDVNIPNPELQRFYFIKTPNGEAQVTANHGLIMADGHARTAEDVAKRFAQGQHDFLMSASSAAVPVLDVKAYDLPELSFNLTIAGTQGGLAEHIVPFGEDEILALDNMGQQALQGQQDELNRQLDREGLTIDGL